MPHGRYVVRRWEKTGSDPGDKDAAFTVIVVHRLAIISLRGFFAKFCEKLFRVLQIQCTERTGLFYYVWNSRLYRN